MGKTINLNDKSTGPFFSIKFNTHTGDMHKQQRHLNDSKEEKINKFKNDTTLNQNVIN